MLSFCQLQNEGRAALLFALTVSIVKDGFRITLIIVIIDLLLQIFHEN